MVIVYFHRSLYSTETKKTPFIYSLVTQWYSSEKQDKCLILFLYLLVFKTLSWFPSILQSGTIHFFLVALLTCNFKNIWRVLIHCSFYLYWGWNHPIFGQWEASQVGYRVLLGWLKSSLKASLLSGMTRPSRLVSYISWSQQFLQGRLVPFRGKWMVFWDVLIMF